MDQLKGWVLRFRLMVKRGLAFAASSIRRRSAAWTILLDALCIVDDTGKIVREVKVASRPEALLAVLNPSTTSGGLD